MIHHIVLQHFIHPNDADERRQTVRTVLDNDFVEFIMAALIGFSVVLVVDLTDATAEGRHAEPYVYVCMMAMNGVYLTEMGLRIYGFSAIRFLKDPWNVLDTTVVLVDTVLTAAHLAGAENPSIAPLRLLRFLKMARAYKTLNKFPELHLMMKGLASALRSMFWGCIVCCTILLGWSVLAVEVLHPMNVEVEATGVYGDCERCGRAFGSVFEAFMTFFQQLVAGDSWGTVSLPLIEHAPWTLFFFSAVLVSVQLVVLNMILAAICDSANQAREGSVKDQAAEKRVEMEKAKHRLIELCKELDNDHSGSITNEELTRGATENAHFQNALLLMDVDPAELPMFFNIVDADDSGTVDYTEFADELLKMKDSQHTMLVFIKHYVIQMKKQLQKNLQKKIEDATLEVLQANGHMPSMPDGDMRQYDIEMKLKMPSALSSLQAPMVDWADVESSSIKQLEELRLTMFSQLKESTLRAHGQLKTLCDIRQSLQDSERENKRITAARLVENKLDDVTMPASWSQMFSNGCSPTSFSNNPTKTPSLVQPPKPTPSLVQPPMR